MPYIIGPSKQAKLKFWILSFLSHKQSFSQGVAQLFLSSGRSFNTSFCWSVGWLVGLWKKRNRKKPLSTTVPEVTGRSNGHHPKWKTTSPKIEDDLNQNGRRPHSKWKTTSPKMENEQKWRWPKMKTTKNEDDKKWRRPKIKMTKNED